MGWAVLEKRLLVAVQPTAVLKVAEMVPENPTYENVELFAPVVLLPERLSYTLVVRIGAVARMRSVPSLVSVLVSQASRQPGTEGVMLAKLPAVQLVASNSLKRLVGQANGPEMLFGDERTAVTHRMEADDLTGSPAPWRQR